MTTCQYPTTIACAERAFWQIFLTNKWDHLFVEQQLSTIFVEQKPPVLPREIAFIPDRRSWGGREADGGFKVCFSAPRFSSFVTIGMKFWQEGQENTILPEIAFLSSVEIDVMILDEALQKRTGLHRLTIPRIEVWQKK